MREGDADYLSRLRPRPRGTPPSTTPADRMRGASRLTASGRGRAPSRHKRRSPDAADDYGAVFTLTPPDFADPLTVTVQQRGTPSASTAWARSRPPTPRAPGFQPGEQVVHPSRGPRTDFATIHSPAARRGLWATRPAANFNDFWGLHVLDAAPPEPVRTDPGAASAGRGRVRDRRSAIDLADGADQLAYILHRGDTVTSAPTSSRVRRLRPRGLAAPGRGPERPLRGTAPKPTFGLHHRGSAG